VKDRAIFSSNLYVDESINPRKLEKIKQKINKKPLLTKVYLVTLSDNVSDLLNIFEARQLVFPYYLDHAVRVVGIFATYDAAVEWIVGITSLCKDERDDYDLKEYLSCRFS